MDGYKRLEQRLEHKLDDLKGQNQTVLETKNERRMKINNIFDFKVDGRLGHQLNGPSSGRSFLK